MDKYAAAGSLTDLSKPVVSGRQRCVVYSALTKSGGVSVVLGALWIGMPAIVVQPSLRMPVLSTLGVLPLLACNLLPSARLEVVDTPLAAPSGLKGRTDTPHDCTSCPLE